MGCPLVVAVVETEQLGAQQPEGQGEQEEADLGAEWDRVAGASAADHQLDEHEREHQADHVGDSKRTAHQRAPPAARRDRMSPDHRGVRIHCHGAG